MDKIVTVHKRISQKHPDISDEDVIWAWERKIRCRMRVKTEPPQYVAAGFDTKGRALEMVAVYDPAAGETLVFHAMKLTESIKKELGLDREGR